MEINLRYKIKQDTDCKCIFCKDNRAFKLPNQLLEAILENKAVIFAGAGISSESRSIFPFSMYDDIKLELKIPKSKKYNFPDLMSKYCIVKGRSKLLQKIKGRLDYIESFPELFRNTTRFHEELSTLYHIQSIITTNWDDYFEKQCGAMPIVNSTDYAFWDNPGRKVFKIHGSINNFGSVVATKEDYDKCYKNLTRGAVGSSLKHFLATKTIIFIGYSFGDYDFNRIYGFIKRDMGDILPRSYVVTPSQTFSDSGLSVINTDGTFFIKTLKKHLVDKGDLINDERFSGVYFGLMRVQSIHFKTSKMNFRKNPALMYSTSYQDGVIHAFERILALKKTGFYSHAHNTQHSVRGYDEIKKAKLKIKKYFDVAYIDGYINGLLYLLADDRFRKFMPLYYVFGSDEDLSTEAKFKKTVAKAQKIHKASYVSATEIVKKYNSAEVLHHTPFLL